MSSKELMKRHDEAFAGVMNETRSLKLRVTDAIRAMTYAEVMKDNERMMNAATVVDALLDGLEPK